MLILLEVGIGVEPVRNIDKEATPLHPKFKPTARVAGEDYHTYSNYDYR